MTSLSSDGKTELAITLLVFALLLLLTGFTPEIIRLIKGLLHRKHQPRL